MTDLKIGTVLPYKGKLYKVMQGDDCTDCDAGHSIDCNEFVTKHNFHCSKFDRDDKTSIKYIEVMRNIDDMNENSHRTIGDMTIKIEEGFSCADCCFCNVCHANGANNNFYFIVRDYFGECANDKRRDGKNIVFTIEGKNMLYIPFTGRLERGVSEANASHTSSASNTYQIIHPRIDEGEPCNVQVVAPGGYLIDTENSDIAQGIIKFKSIYPTYANIINQLNVNTSPESIDNRTKSIIALFNIAKYYNGDWKPKWGNEEYKHFIVYNYAKDKFEVHQFLDLNYGMPVFKNKDDAQSVIDNPNFRNILDNIFKV